MDPLSFLNTQNLIIYSVPMARRVGITASVLLSQLIAARSIRPVEHDGELWVSLSSEELYDLCCVPHKDQEVALRKLTTSKIIKQKVFGSPPLRHFLLNEKKIIEISGRLA